eukprot:PhF_6_TR5702/c0_g1_i1/m.8401/K03946/NDUFA2; NADH dehydrogenase (ubiquinone) 1 alpha subcomplex subunit 2
MAWRCRFSPCIGSVLSFINPKDPLCYGVRSWWRKNMTELQLLNPGCTVSIQELSYGEPVMYVQYSHHDQRVVRLTGTTEEEMDEIMQACVTYGMNHAQQMRPHVDDGGDPLLTANIISFSYAESYIARLEMIPPNDSTVRTTMGVDDPGQKVRTLYPRNDGTKIAP